MRVLPSSITLMGNGPVTTVPLSTVTGLGRRPRTMARTRTAPMPGARKRRSGFVRGLRPVAARSVRADVDGLFMRSIAGLQGPEQIKPLDAPGDGGEGNYGSGGDNQ